MIRMTERQQPLLKPAEPLLTNFDNLMRPYKMPIDASPVSAHKELYFTFAYVLKGRGVLSCNGIEADIREGSMLHLEIFSFYSIAADEPIELFVLPLGTMPCYTACRYILETSARPCAIEDNDHYRKNTFPVTQLREDCITYANSIVEKILAVSERGDSLCGYDILSLYHLLSSLPVDEPEMCFTFDDIDINWQVFNYILADPVGAALDEAARKFKLMKPEIDRRLRAVCGYSFKELKNYLMIAMMAQRFFYDDASIADIAKTIGFTSVSSMLKLFKKHFCMTPSEYRRRAARDYGSGLYMTPLVTKSLDYLEQHYRDNIALDDLAQHLQISKHLTNEMFMKYFGHDFYEVLQMIRIHAAGSLLEISDASVTDIAFLCGYDSVTTFLSHFKKWKHMAPSDYRKLSAAEYMA